MAAEVKLQQLLVLVQALPDTGLGVAVEIA